MWVPAGGASGGVASFNGRTGAVTLISGDVTTALGYTPVSAALLGVANGVATLDGSGKLTLSQLPPSVVGALIYQGTWNANTNTPTLMSGVGTKGWYYVVSVAGTTTVDGNSQWNVGDTIVFNGTVWDKIDGISSEVISVAGRTGAVVLSISDISGGAPLASPAFTGVPTAPTPLTADNSTTVATTAYIQNQGYITGNQTITLSGAVTGSGTTAISTVLATVVNNTILANVSGITASPSANSISSILDSTV